MDLRRALWGKKGSTYAGRVYQVLATYRFLALVVAVFLHLLRPPAEALTSQIYILFSLVGLYTIFKTLSPTSDKEFWTRVLLGGDVLVCLSLVLVSGGLLSGFLLYSLCPVITAALFLLPKQSVPYSLPLPLSLALVHSAFGHPGGAFSPILTGNLLTALILYSAISLSLPALAQVTNVNIRRHIEIEATLSERKRIAQELHDGAAQKLSYLNLRLKMLQSRFSDAELGSQLRDLAETTGDVYQDVRASIDALSLEFTQDFREQLAEHLADFERQTGLRTEFSAPSSLPALPPLAKLQLLRILQEALNNVQKHAQASQVWVQLKVNRELELTIRDNGRGIPEKRLNGYHGLSIMKERAESLGGEFELSSSEQGTEIRVRIPL